MIILAMKARFLVYIDPSRLVGKATERDPIPGLPTKAGARAGVRSEVGAGAQRATDVIVSDIWLYFPS